MAPCQSCCWGGRRGGVGGKEEEEEEECYLVPLEVGPAAGSKALLAAEALQLAAHAEGVALHANLLAPGAHDLHVGCVVVWGNSSRQRKTEGQDGFVFYFPPRQQSLSHLHDDNERPLISEREMDESSNLTSSLQLLQTNKQWHQNLAQISVGILILLVSCLPHDWPLNYWFIPELEDNMCPTYQI